EREAHGIGVANFADVDDLGRLAQAVLQGNVPVLRVDADLALADQGLLVRVDVFDRVLDGHDVTAHALVAVIDHGGQGGGLTSAGGAGDQHHAAFLHDELAEAAGQAQFVERGDDHGDAAQHEGDA